jgi:hypothetical protein
MEAQFGPVLVGLFVVGMVGLWLGADRADVRPVPGRLPRVREPAQPPPGPPPPPVGDGLVATGALVVVPPAGGSPTEPVPLRDWMVHLHPEPQSMWTEVVRELTSAAVADPGIGPYFAGTDPTTVQRHFLAMLMTITGEGITEDAVQRVRRAHCGLPVTPGSYDACARLVVDVLEAKGVPAPTLRHVAYLLLVLRDAVLGARPAAFAH